MTKSIIQNTTKETNLYNKILLLSRNKLFYTKFYLDDTFQNRIILIFIHISFLFININKLKDSEKYKPFHQNMFDLIFKKIEFNMREIGYGDVAVNKNMKFLVKTFYNILLNCENFKKKSLSYKINFFNKHLKFKDVKKLLNNTGIIAYFEKYETFCFDLNPNSVLKGDLKFNYK